MQVPSQVVERLKTIDYKKLRDIRKILELHRIII